MSARAQTTSTISGGEEINELFGLDAAKDRSIADRLHVSSAAMRAVAELPVQQSLDLRALHDALVVPESRVALVVPGAGFTPAMTGAFSSDAEVVRSYGPGANAYVGKPVAFDELVEAGRVLGLFWLLLNEPPPGSRAAS